MQNTISEKVSTSCPARTLGSSFIVFTNVLTTPRSCSLAFKLNHVRNFSLNSLLTWPPCSSTRMVRTMFSKWTSHPSLFTSGAVFCVVSGSRNSSFRSGIGRLSSRWVSLSVPAPLQDSWSSFSLPRVGLGLLWRIFGLESDFASALLLDRGRELGTRPSAIWLPEITYQ